MKLNQEENHKINNKIKPLNLNEILSTKNTNNTVEIQYKTTNPKDKKLKYSHSITTINNINHKNKYEKNSTRTLSSSQLKDIKNDIYSIYNTIKANKQKYLKNKKIKNKSISTEYNINKNKYNEKKFEIYDMNNLAYKIYHDYQKLHFNYKKIPFLKRMELYRIKKSLKDIKINEYLKLKSPKISEEKRKKIFDNLTNDVIIRKQKKELNSNIVEKNEKKISQKKVNEIIKRLYTNKKNNIIKKEDINKDNNENNEKESNDKNFHKKRNKINKCNSQSNINKINELNQRLYYNHFQKQDIPYKLFLQKIDDILNTNNINNKSINKNLSNDKSGNNIINNDYMSYSQLENLRKNKMNNPIINIKTLNILKVSDYNFKEDENSLINTNKDISINNINKITEKDNNDDIISNGINNKSTNIPNYSNKNLLNNNSNNIQNENNDNKLNEIFYTLPEKNNTNLINNLKVSLIIDNFFCNKPK